MSNVSKRGPKSIFTAVGLLRGQIRLAKSSSVLEITLDAYKIITIFGLANNVDDILLPGGVSGILESTQPWSSGGAIRRS